jgi:pimeloyl-ACP methyl ester carboxylesterase
MNPSAQWRKPIVIPLLLGLLTLSPFTPAIAAPAPPAHLPVVLIHGLNPDNTWVTMVAQLQAAGYTSGTYNESTNTGTTGTIFAPDLSLRPEEKERMGILGDQSYLISYIKGVLKLTGAAQVDLVGYSRGGLVVRLLATGEASTLVHHAVTLDAPHNGVMTSQEMAPLFAAANLPLAARGALVTEDIEANSDAIRTIQARDKRFSDRQSAALVVASTWQEGAPAFFTGHDGVTKLESQLAWETGNPPLEPRLGPTGAELSKGLDLAVLLNLNPMVQSHEDPTTLQKVIEFLNNPAVQAPARKCEPTCQDFTSL